MTDKKYADTVFIMKMVLQDVMSRTGLVSEVPLSIVEELIEFVESEQIRHTDELMGHGTMRHITKILHGYADFLKIIEEVKNDPDLKDDIESMKNSFGMT